MATKRSIARAILTNQLFADSPSFFTYHEPVDSKVDSMHKLLEIKGKQAIKMLRKTFADSPTELGEPCAQELHTCAGGGLCGKEGICTCADERVWFQSACVQHQALPTKAAVPGAYCDQFVICTGGSICEASTCVCPKGTAVQLGICVKLVVGAGFSCASGEVCSAGSYCANSGICVCPPGTVQIDAQCIQQSMGGGGNVPPNSPCSSTSVCMGGSICLNGVCLCPTGYVLRGNQCVMSANYAQPGQPCSIGTTMCLSGSICANGVCTCPLGGRLVGGRCISVPESTDVKPNYPCTAGVSTCTGGSNCIQGVCTCPTGMESVNDICQNPVIASTVQPGGACSALSICTGGSSCLNGICACPPETFISGGACKPSHISSIPGETCTSQTKCIGGSFCFNSYCTCPQGQVIFNQECVPFVATVYPGSSCSAAGIVCGGGSNCQDGLCKCPENLVIGQGGAACVTSNKPTPGNTAAPLESCTPSFTVCQGDSICSPIYNHCVCAQNKVAQYGQCVAQPISLGPGSACDPYCVGSNVCALQCSSGARCDQETGYCTCQYGAMINSVTGQCALQPVSPTGIPSIATSSRRPPSLTGFPGDPCDQNTICIGRSRCRNGVCTCEPGLIAQNGALTCTPGTTNVVPITASVPPGSPCTAGTTICLGGSQCTMGYCLCPVQMVNIAGTCTYINSAVIVTTTSQTVAVSSAAPSTAQPGGACVRGITVCQGASGCVNNYCVCADGQMVSTLFQCTDAAQVDTNSVLPGSVCSPTLSCGRNAECLNSRCVCTLPATTAVNGYCVTPAEGTNQSVQSGTTPQTVVSGSVLLGGQCTQDIQCSATAQCRNGICYCRNGYTPILGVCQPIGGGGGVQLGGQCDSISRCRQNLICTNGFCVCPPGSRPTSDGRCMRRRSSVPPGSWCSTTAGVDCHGGAYCYENSCMCPFGQVIVSLQCQEAPIVLPGHSCQNGEVCGGGSICSSGTCECAAPSSRNGPYCTSEIVARAPPCQPEACQLPDCYCSRTGTEIPGGLPASRTPQMIIITVDDAMTERVADLLNGTNSLFANANLRNRNGCPIKATFFISHEYNKYDTVEWLAYNGHEIGVNSITHTRLDAEPVDRWSREMDGMRRTLQALSNIPSEKIRGVRAPLLAVGGDNQFEMMVEQGFLYDNSMSANPGRSTDPFWPQTLDYRISWKCEVPPCPQRSYRGVWALPLNQYYGYYIPEIKQHKRAAMVRAAMLPTDSVETVKQMLRDNFDRAYTTNRAPYVLTLDADFLTILPDNGGVRALTEFLQEVLQLPDVWVVTAEQAIAWMRQPTPTDRLSSFGAWSCIGMQEYRNNGIGQRQHDSVNGMSRPKCNEGRVCGYETSLRGKERWLTTCNVCPIEYPWLNDPLGEGRDMTWHDRRTTTRA